MKDQVPAFEPASIDKSLDLACDALAAIAIFWPPNFGVVVRLLEAIVRLTALQLQISGGGKDDAWRTSAIQVVEEIRQTLAMNGDTNHAS